MPEEKLTESLWEIVRAVAAVNSTGYIETYGNACPFCKSYPRRKSSPDNVKHEDSCIVVKARKLAEKGVTWQRNSRNT